MIGLALAALPACGKGPAPTGAPAVPDAAGNAAAPPQAGAIQSHPLRSKNFVITDYSATLGQPVAGPIPGAAPAPAPAPGAAPAPAPAPAPGVAPAPARAPQPVPPPAPSKGHP